MRSSPLPKVGSLASVVAACVCAAVLWPSGALGAPPPTDPDWHWIQYAHEGESFTVSPHTVVRYVFDGIPIYGKDGRSPAGGIEKEARDGRVECNDAFFGARLLSGIPMACAVVGRWDRVANENQAFMTDPATVRYGVNLTPGIPEDYLLKIGGRDDLPGGHWAYRRVDGQVQCSNAVFGDPAYGHVKSCWKAVVAPPGTPSTYAADR